MTQLTLGMCCIGRVESLGPDSVSLKIGQLVFFDITVRARDNPNTVMLQGFYAPREEGADTLQKYWRNGAFAEKILVPLENVHPIPEYLFEKYGAAKLSEMSSILVPYGGFLSAGFEPGQSVMIQPATGNFGAAGVPAALAMGASRVYVVGRNSDVLNAFVKRFGPRVKPVVVKGTDEDKNIYAGLEPVDVILNIYPWGAPVESTVHGMAALRRGGTLVLMGGIPDAVPLPYLEMMMKSITVKGQYMYPPSAIRKLVGLIEAGLLDLNAFEEKSFKIDDVLDAVKYASNKDTRLWLASTVLEP